MSIGGPFIKTERVPSSGYPCRFKTQHVYRQGRPYRSVLPYYLTQGAATDFWSEVGCANAATSAGLENHDRLLARCYDQFWNRARAQANNAVNIAELDKSLLMVGSRCRQAYDILKNLKNGNVSGLLKSTLGPRDRIPKAAANSWLEFTFGWMPIIKDVASNIEVLQHDFDGNRRVKGKSSASWSQTARPDLVPNSRDYWTDSAVVMNCSVSGFIRVDNPNEFLANQLGFVNPAVVAWDLVPFSFVLDWFLPVGKFLNSFTNEFGCQVENPLTTSGTKANHFAQSMYKGWDGTLTVERSDAADSFTFIRETKITRPGLFDRKKIPDPSLWYALTSSSLLMQQIGRFRS